MTGLCSIRPVGFSALVLVAAVAAGPQVYAQTTLTTEGDTVVINCPDELDLQVMVDYVGKALGLRFLYGEELKNQRVELRPSP